MTREDDIKAVCQKITSMDIKPTGDYGTGGECPFCECPCRWDANDVSEIEHNAYCIYLIAKDLLT